MNKKLREHFDAAIKQTRWNEITLGYYVFDVTMRERNRFPELSGVRQVLIDAETGSEIFISTDTAETVTI